MSAAQACNHGRRWAVCKDCRGPGICEHNRIGKRCKECHLVDCSHGVTKALCPNCSTTTFFCVHKKDKTKCRDCGGSAFCIHGKDKCKICYRKCIHNKRERSCSICKPEA